MLAVGGMLVYSTCSFNPIENEAVVGHLLEMSDGVYTYECRQREFISHYVLFYLKEL